MPVPKKYVASSGRVTWRVRLRANNRNTSETFSSKAEALDFCRMVKQVGAQAAIAEREHQEQNRGETLDELAEQFFAWKAGRVRSDRTVADYRRDYDKWIRPTLGWRHAATVTESDIRAWVESMEPHLSPKSIADRHAILHGIYAFAVSPAQRILEHNPCVGTDLPKRRRSLPKGLWPAEWQALHRALHQIDPDAADLAEFLLATGWRISEAAALSAFGVEDDGRQLYVTMGRVLRRNAAGQHVIVEDAKSTAGQRRIKLDADVAEMVRRRLESVQGDGLVFTTRTGQQWHYANFLNRAWKPAVKAANLARNPTPHWLRHTSVAWLVMTRKVSLPEIQRRIGHESINTTINVYGRMVDDVPDEALRAFAAMRAGSEPPEAAGPIGPTEPPQLQG